jgi:hypothetical protein
MGERWQVDGVHEWIAHDRATGALVGRGGLSQVVVDVAVTDVHNAGSHASWRASA